MSSKMASAIIIGMLTLALIAVTVVSVIAYGRLSRRLSIAEMTYNAHRAETEDFVQTSGHFTATVDWAGSLHVEQIRHSGATTCFNCHTETFCSDCHVATKNHTTGSTE